MRKIVQLIGAVLAGLVVSGFITRGFENMLAHFYPLPELMPSALEMANYVAEAPAELQVLQVFGFGLSAWFGGYVAGRFSPASKQELSAFVVAFCYLLGLIVFLISMPRPIWAALLCVGAVVLAPFLVVFIFRKMNQSVHKM
ncbi:MAG: hypothetical protein ACR2IL_11060 [Chitinophagaceae bacterium]